MIEANPIARHHTERMLTFDLATELSDAGLVWKPIPGDAFTLRERSFDAEIFTVSELTIEAREYAGGTALAFNGTSEWALDSVSLEDALWLPREDQLRELLGGTFIALTRDDTVYVVHALDPSSGEDLAFQANDAAQAYALAVLALVLAAAH